MKNKVLLAWPRIIYYCIESTAWIRYQKPILTVTGPEDIFLSFTNEFAHAFLAWSRSQSLCESGTIAVVLTGTLAFSKGFFMRQAQQSAWLTNSKNLGKGMSPTSIQIINSCRTSIKTKGEWTDNRDVRLKSLEFKNVLTDLKSQNACSPKYILYECDISHKMNGEGFACLCYLKSDVIKM